MPDSVSSTSSREPTPCYENGYTSPSKRYSAASTSIADLSEYLNQHHLTSRRPNISRDGSTARARQHNRSLQSANGLSNRVCRRRQSLSRLQCSSTHLSRISALVDDVVLTGLPTYDPTHPYPMLDDSTSPTLSPDEQHSSATSFLDLTSNSRIVSYGYGSAQHCSRRLLSNNIDKDLRQSASGDGLSSDTLMVKKKIRMRKSSKKLSMGRGRGGSE